jgi:hypothetical protein
VSVRWLIGCACALPAALGAQRADRRVSVGQTVRDSLTTSAAAITADGTFAQAWTISGNAGRVVTVDLVSSAFDAFLIVRGPGIDSSHALQDDDSGGRCNARLTVTFPASDDFTIIVTTSDPRATGAFTLSVRPGAIPPSLERCRRTP